MSGALIEATPVKLPIRAECAIGDPLASLVKGDDGTDIQVASRALALNLSLLQTMGADASNWANGHSNLVLFLACFWHVRYYRKKFNVFSIRARLAQGAKSRVQSFMIQKLSLFNTD